MKRETGANPVRTRHCDKGVEANTSLILIGKTAVNDDLSARRPALDEVTTATRNWSGMDETGLTMSIYTSMPLWQWRFFYYGKSNYDTGNYVQCREKPAGGGTM